MVAGQTSDHAFVVQVNLYSQCRIRLILFSFQVTNDKIKPFNRICSLIIDDGKVLTQVCYESRFKYLPS